jgi:hypothetical protein
VAEVSVNHRPRSEGTSKYGIWNRLPRATLDLFAVCWMRRRWIDLSATVRGQASPAPPAAGVEDRTPVGAAAPAAPARESTPAS